MAKGTGSDSPKVISRDFLVGARDEGLRLDELLARDLGVSRSLAARLIREGKVLVDGLRAKPSTRPRPGAGIAARFEEPGDEEALAPAPLDLDVLFEDRDLAVLNKPPGLVVHPGAGKHEVTLVEGLLARFGPLPTLLGEDRPGVVHRLDRDTSGLIIIARTHGAQAELCAMFKDRRMDKEYLALAYGAPKEGSGAISAAIARHPARRKKMAVVEEGGRRAETIYELVEDFGEISLIRLNLVTGRTHQIRVHLAHIGHPVVGDLVYGGRARYRTIKETGIRDAVKKVGRQMLHAHRLSFTHPGTGEAVSFTAPIPEDMAGLIDLLRSFS